MSRTRIKLFFLLLIFIIGSTISLPSTLIPEDVSAEQITEDITTIIIGDSYGQMSYGGTRNGVEVDPAARNDGWENCWTGRLASKLGLSDKQTETITSPETKCSIYVFEDNILYSASGRGFSAIVSATDYCTMVSELKSYVDADKVSLIVLGGGANDTKSYNQSKLKSATEKLITTAHQLYPNAKIVIAQLGWGKYSEGMLPEDYVPYGEWDDKLQKRSDYLNADLDTVCDNYDYAYYAGNIAKDILGGKEDTYFTGKLNNEQYDPVHPNYLGEKALANELYERISEIINHDEPVIENVSRIFGETRYETSLKVADELKAVCGLDKFDAVILADGKNYPDALAGNYLSCVLNAPILLVDSKQDHIAPVQTYIKTNLKEGGTIYILGGTAVVSDTVVAGLNGYTQNRLGGKDRYETNIKILEEATKFSQDNEILVCTGTGFADSLSAAGLGKPILLVKNSLQDSQKKYLNSPEAKTFDIIGGTGAVSDTVMNEFKAYGPTTRIGGSTRYQTSTYVAKYFYGQSAAGVVAYGKNFPDGLCGGALAYAMNGPLILTENGKTQAAETYMSAAEMQYGAVLGGTTLISDKSVRDIFHMEDSADIIVK